ncbi:MAG TPA: cysteine-rich CWC family protein [Ramlibacter sp.]|nr:cysteine-rich CWC family protein [Ramlibacter sp.]
MKARIDPTRCPICGQPNQCANEIARATGLPQSACWCTGVDFASELLARVPAAAKRLACICAACAARGLTPPDGPPGAP